MGRLAPPEHDRDLHLRALVEESLDVSLLGVVVVHPDLRPKLDLLDLELALGLAPPRFGFRYGKAAGHAAARFLVSSDSVEPASATGVGREVRNGSAPAFQRLEGSKPSDEVLQRKRGLLAAALAHREAVVALL